jgi:GT2 family glycosyltransferase
VIDRHTSLPSCCVVIPTLGDREQLRTVVECLRGQSAAIPRVVVSLGSDVPRPIWCGPEDESHRWLQAPEKGAAAQRNYAARTSQEEIIAFLDDDISFGGDLFEKVLKVFAEDQEKRIGAVSPRMAGSGHPRPSRLLRRYYRWQAGYDDATFGARLFGYGLNLYPCYEVQTETRVAADWLNSPCLFVRREDFLMARFPDFHGYSFGEDVYLTAMIKKRGKKLFFLSDVEFEHHAGVGDYKADHFRLARMKTRNQGRIAREVLGMKGWRYWSRKVTHQLFVTACLVRDRKRGWMCEIAGVWSA